MGYRQIAGLHEYLKSVTLYYIVNKSWLVTSADVKITIYLSGTWPVYNPLKIRCTEIALSEINMENPQ